MMFPASGKQDVDLALNFTQRFGGSSLTFGKINMLETVARTPLISGGGLEGFQHAALATPPSELTPPWIVGALWSKPTPRVVLSAGAWDVRSALNRNGLRAPFSEGIAGMTSFTFPIHAGGERGFHGFTLMATTKRGVDLEDLGDLLLPPESEHVRGEKRGGWHVKYFFQQFLWHDDTPPDRGGVCSVTFEPGTPIRRPCNGA
jgi:porin